MPEIQQHFPGTTFAGSKGDKLDFGSNVNPKDGVPLGVIDVIRAAGNGGEAWQWLPVGESNGANAGSELPAFLGFNPYGGVGFGWSGMSGELDPLGEEQRARRQADQRWQEQIDQNRIDAALGPYRRR